ncbi:MAG: hypothetical protein ACTTHG_04600 [Treponemataceae bacterium]
MKNALTFIEVAVLFCLFGCVSNSEYGKNDVMLAMIYDYDNKTVPEASVFVDNKFAGFSDVHGRFIFSCPKEKNFNVRIEKENFEKLDFQAEFNPLNLLYIKIGNIDQYFSKSEEKLFYGELEQAWKFCQKSKKCVSSENLPESLLYLEAIILHKCKDFVKSNEILSFIKTDEKNKKFIEELKTKNDKQIKSE